MNPLKRIKRVLNSTIESALQKWGRSYAYDTLPPETMRAAASIPFVAETLVKFSIEEYDRNPYYQLVIDNLMNHTVGPSTGIIGISQRVRDRDNDLVEDSYNEWTSSNQIGKAYREIRKEAAKTGIGIGIPFKDFNSINPVQTSFKVYGYDCLKTPYDSIPSDRIINGIEYDSNWEIRAFHLSNNDKEVLSPRVINGLETKEYRVEEVVYWARNRQKGMVWPIPECYSAFAFYPYVRRYLQAVLQAEEFRASFPMAIELDPAVYSSYSSKVREKEPSGSFEYEPGMVPTLAPGMKLNGLPHSVSAADREQIMRMFAATCALSVSMPRNLALGDSSNSNMASAQVDIQPWANKVNIDRFDMEPMFRRSFKMWWDIAVRRVMNSNIREKHLLMFPHVYVYPDLFEHPDPNKRASARALDLASGATTLNRMYSNRGMNFRREIEREAKALGIKPDELIKIYISSRSVNALSVLLDTNNQAQEDSSGQTAPADSAS